VKSKTPFNLPGIEPVKHPAVYIVFGNTVFQGKKLFQPCFFAFLYSSMSSQPLAKAITARRVMTIPSIRGRHFFRLIRGSLMSLKKSIMGGTVSGIIITSSLTSIGFFYPFFTPFLIALALPKAAARLSIVSENFTLKSGKFVREYFTPLSNG
jgi:hypothetical protein